jgi:hypothetical protein
MYTLLDINISIFAFLNGCAWDFFIIFPSLCSSRSPRAVIAAENFVILECPKGKRLNDMAKQASGGILLSAKDKIFKLGSVLQTLVDGNSWSLTGYGPR